MLINTMSTLFWFYIDPIVGVQFSELGVSQINIGYSFALMSGGFGLGSLAATVLSVFIHRRYVT